MPRCAIVEHNNYHDHVLASWVDYLHELGFTIDVFTGPENLQRLPLEHVEYLKPRQISMGHVLPLVSWRKKRYSASTPSASRKN